MQALKLNIIVSLEADGRYIAEVPDLPGTVAYGYTASQATCRVQKVVFTTLAEGLGGTAQPFSALTFEIHGEPLTAA